MARPDPKTTSNESNDEQSLLLALPNELQLRIFIEAVKHQGPIKPEQWLPGSRLFVNEYPYVTFSGHSSRNSLPPHPVLPVALTALNLTQTCKSIHKIVSQDYLFHKANTFEFSTFKSAVTYLSALPADRRNEIRAISIFYEYQGSSRSAVTLLAACTNLQYLELDISLMGHFFNDDGIQSFLQAPGISKLLKLRGLKKLSLTFTPWAWDPTNTRAGSQVRIDKAKELEEYVNGFVTRPRVAGSDITQARIDQAVNNAGVELGDIDASTSIVPPILFSCTMNTSTAPNDDTFDPAVPWVFDENNWQDTEEVRELWGNEDW